MVLDSILNARDYDSLEPELIADWRAHYAANCLRMREVAVTALRHALQPLRSSNPEAADELSDLERRLAPA